MSTSVLGISARFARSCGFVAQLHHDVERRPTGRKFAEACVKIFVASNALQPALGKGVMGYDEEACSFILQSSNGSVLSRSQSFTNRNLRARFHGLTRLFSPF